MNGLKVIGSVSVGLGIILLILPLLSTPVIKGLAFWHGVFAIEDVHIEVKVGFWGTCTYYKGRRDFGHHDDDEDEMEHVECTDVKPGYSFAMSSTVPDAAGEVSSGQTIFLFWLLIAALVATIAFGLSFSPNYAQWRHAAILSLTACILAVGTFLACVVIFTGLTREIKKTQSAKTIPLVGSLQGDSFFPLSASVLLAIGAWLIWSSFKQEFWRRHRGDGTQRKEQQISLVSLGPSPLPPPVLAKEGIDQEKASDARKSRCDDDRRGEQDKVKNEIEEIREEDQEEKRKDGEAETEFSLFEGDSFESSSFSYLQSSLLEGLPPPPPLQTHHQNNHFHTRKV